MHLHIASLQYDSPVQLHLRDTYSYPAHATYRVGSYEALTFRCWFPIRQYIRRAVVSHLTCMHSVSSRVSAMYAVVPRPAVVPEWSANP